MVSPIVTPTQSRTTFSGSPCETPPMMRREDNFLNPDSSLGSCLEFIYPIDGHGTIVTPFDEFLSVTDHRRKANSKSSARDSTFQATKDIPENFNFIFTRSPPSFYNPV